MKFLKFIPVFVALLSFFSCKNELKLNAPYKEIPTVYAVLNPYENIQVIRVNKVFLGEGDANVMAKVADSINYAAGELNITLERFVEGKQAPAVEGSPEQIITFRDSMVNTNPGAFNTSQRVYVTSKKLFTNGQYKLTVKNIHTGSVFTATANALERVWPELQPLIAPYFEYPQHTAPELYIDYSSTTSKYPYEVKHKVEEKYGQIYQLVLRMHLYDTVSGQNHTRQAIDYLVGTKSIKDAQLLSGQKYVTHTFTGSAIFAEVGKAVSKMNQNIYGRKMYSVEYFIYSSSQEYQDYNEYIKPSLSIAQNKPLYSNFENATALGLFTFRTHLNVEKNISNTYISSFSNNPSTCSYKFVTSDGKTIRGCK